MSLPETPLSPRLIGDASSLSASVPQPRPDDLRYTFSLALLDARHSKNRQATLRTQLVSRLGIDARVWDLLLSLSRGTR